MKSFLRSLFILILLSFSVSAFAEQENENKITKALIFGDSMAGWLGERLNAYGEANGFSVGTVVWDGATIQKFANSPQLKAIIDKQNPQVVFVCLGMNNLAEPRPAVVKPALDKILEAIGDRRLVWIGPPSWPGKPKWTALNNYLESTLGEDHYFNSFSLTLPRQSASNPHPTREGMIKWGDALAAWLPEHVKGFSQLHKPSVAMVRGKYFLYKRMKEKL